MVAPRAGAWIEMQEVGIMVVKPRLVAPRAGAWIEMLHFPRHPFPLVVAPRAGAWIEITGGLFGRESS